MYFNVVVRTLPLLLTALSMNIQLNVGLPSLDLLLEPALRRRYHAHAVPKPPTPVVSQIKQLFNANSLH
jgi:hypothetical protein